MRANIAVLAMTMASVQARTYYHFETYDDNSCGIRFGDSTPWQGTTGDGPYRLNTPGTKSIKFFADSTPLKVHTCNTNNTCTIPGDQANGGEACFDIGTEGAKCCSTPQTDYVVIDP